MKKKLFSAVGTFVKTFIAAIITLSIAHKSASDIQLTEIAWGALASSAPVLINFFNPNDARYGIVKKRK